MPRCASGGAGCRPMLRASGLASRASTSGCASAYPSQPRRIAAPDSMKRRRRMRSRPRRGISFRGPDNPLETVPETMPFRRNGPAIALRRRMLNGLARAARLDRRLRRQRASPANAWTIRRLPSAIHKARAAPVPWTATCRASSTTSARVYCGEDRSHRQPGGGPGLWSRALVKAAGARTASSTTPPRHLAHGVVNHNVVRRPSRRLRLIETHVPPLWEKACSLGAGTTWARRRRVVDNSLRGAWRRCT